MVHIGCKAVLLIIQDVSNAKLEHTTGIYIASCAIISVKKTTCFFARKLIYEEEENMKYTGLTEYEPACIKKLRLAIRPDHTPVISGSLHGWLV